MADSSDQLRRAGWRQGDLVSQECTTRLIASSIDRKPCSDTTPLLVVISQDCDIVKVDSAEPYIELIGAVSVPKVDKSMQAARNPRRLHVSDQERTLEFSIHDKFRVSKTDFCPIAVRESSWSFSDETRHQIRKWLGLRYLRPSFPDEFNRRLDTNKGRLVEFSKSDMAKSISLILFYISHEELPADTPYDLEIIAGITDETSVEKRDDIEDTLIELFELEGIRVQNARALIETDITVRDLRSYKRWNLDYRSLPEAPGIAAPPEYIDEI